MIERNKAEEVDEQQSKERATEKKRAANCINKKLLAWFEIQCGHTHTDSVCYFLYNNYVTKLNTHTHNIGLLSNMMIMLSSLI